MLTVCWIFFLQLEFLGLKIFLNYSLLRFLRFHSRIKIIINDMMIEEKVYFWRKKLGEDFVKN